MKLLLLFVLSFGLVPGVTGGEPIDADLEAVVVSEYSGVEVIDADLDGAFVQEDVDGTVSGHAVSPDRYDLVVSDMMPLANREITAGARYRVTPARRLKSMLGEPLKLPN